MDFQNRKVNFILGCTALLFIFIKLFTSIAVFRDDPTTFFVVRLTPAFDNRIFVTVEELSSYIILAVDENGLIGDSLYLLLTNYFWWISIVAFIINLVIKLRNKNC